ncbi:c-type cytochrome domain-containing protein, partial [Larkinella soli]|uniref:c-type cytochrome domain-containing protein n=1 Tax=Larkinella soli TaxID=1770527 RepID=UPI001E621456
MMPGNRFLWVALGLTILSSIFWLGFREDRVDFNTQVKPLLNKHCIACHGGVKKASNFSLLFPHEALAPAKSGRHPIVPGDAAASE